MTDNDGRKAATNRSISRLEHGDECAFQTSWADCPRLEAGRSACLGTTAWCCGPTRMHLLPPSIMAYLIRSVVESPRFRLCHSLHHRSSRTLVFDLHGSGPHVHTASATIVPDGIPDAEFNATARSDLSRHSVMQTTLYILYGQQRGHVSTRVDSEHSQLATCPRPAPRTAAPRQTALRTSVQFGREQSSCTHTTSLAA